MPAFLPLLAIALLPIATALVWSRYKHAWWVAYCLFLVVSLAAHWIRPVALLSLAGFALIVWCSTRTTGRWLSYVVNTLLVLSCLLAASHMAPGFEHIHLLENTRLSESTGWSSLRFSADKPSIGLFLLVAHRHRLCSTTTEIFRCLRKTVATIAFGCLVIYTLALIIGFSSIDPTFSLAIVLWFFRNLFYTVIAEEALFRGFIQTRVLTAANSRLAPVIAIAVSAFTFGSVHFYGGWKYGLLATLSGVLYAVIYNRTHRLEAAIAAHATLNTGHILLLSYP